MDEIQVRIERLERRDGWLWPAAILWMPLLVPVALPFPTLWKQEHPFFPSRLQQAVLGLLGLVLPFTYAVHRDELRVSWQGRLPRVQAAI